MPRGTVHLFSYHTILWNSDSEEFSDVIVRVSSFRLTCAFMGALGKKMRCSGFEQESSSNQGSVQVD